jgi:hypothetical protein
MREVIESDSDLRLYDSIIVAGDSIDRMLAAAELSVTVFTFLLRSFDARVFKAAVLGHNLVFLSKTKTPERKSRPAFGVSNQTKTELCVTVVSLGSGFFRFQSLTGMT